MTTVTNILDKVRIELSDKDKARWDDKTLVSLAADAQFEISYKTNCLHKSISIFTSADKNSYILPSDVRLINNVTYNGSNLTLISREDIANIDKSWATSIGTPEYAIYSDIDRGILKLSPIPSDTAEILIDYIYTPNEITSISDNFILGNSYNIALVYYIVYRALNADFDAKDANMSDRYYRLYSNELRRLGAESAKSFLTNSRGFNSHYQGFV